jgi:hypothetical protein
MREVSLWTTYVNLSLCSNYLYQKFIPGERVAVNHEPWTEADEVKDKG